MKSNRVYMHKAVFVPVIVAVLFANYGVLKEPNPLGLAPVEHNDGKQNGHLAKLDTPCRSVSGTLLDVAGQFVVVQAADSPHTISVVCVNEGDFPVGFASGKTVITHGEFKKGLFDTDNMTITGGTPWTALDKAPQPIGVIDHIIFFIAYYLL